jgi:hypothetical protein
VHILEEVGGRIACGGGYARDGSLRLHCAFKILRVWLYRVVRNVISIHYLQRKSAVLIFLILPYPSLARVRNELDSGRNPAPHSPTTNPAARGGSGDVPGNEKRLDRRRVVQQQDSCLQFSNGRVELDISWVSERGLGCLVSGEGVVVVVGL